MEQVAWHSSARISSTPSKPIKTRDTCPLDPPATNYLPPHAHFKTSLRNPARSNQAPHIQFIFGPSNPLTQTTRRSRQEGLPNPLFDTRFDVPRVFATRGLVAPYRTPRAPPPLRNAQSSAGTETSTLVGINLHKGRWALLPLSPPILLPSTSYRCHGDEDNAREDSVVCGGCGESSLEILPNKRCCCIAYCTKRFWDGIRTIVINVK